VDAPIATTLVNEVIKGKRAERGGKYSAVQFLSTTSEKPLTLQ
jgi:hypothetical protein